MFIVAQLSGQARYFDERYIFSQSYVQPVLVNPGAIGATPYHTVLLGYRNTWASFEGTPRSFILSYDGQVANNLGVGVQVLSDTNGSLETTKGLLGASYTIRSPQNVVGLGLTGELIQHSVDSGVLNDNLVDPDDPIVLARFDGLNFFDVSFGAHGVYDEQIIYGVAFPSLVSSLLSEKSDIEVDRGFSYVVHGGYIVNLPEYDLKVTPSIMLKQFMHVPFHADINVLGQFLNERLTGGINYRVGADENLGMLIGARIDAFNFFYSYNFSRHEFQQYNNGSHEISVRFDIGRKDKVAMEEEEMMEKEMMDK